jgi:phosphoserine phosphatase
MRKDRRLAIFDVDGTLTKVKSVWEFLHRELGIWETNGRNNLEAYLKKEIDYEEFSRRDALGFKNITYQELLSLIRIIPRREGLQECMVFLKESGFQVVYLSTGLNILVDDIPGADIRLANELLFEDDICRGEVITHIPIDGKKAAFKNLLSKLQISAENAFVFGDSTGDIEIMDAAGCSIGVAPSDEAVKAVSDYVINGDDLTEIIRIVEEVNMPSRRLAAAGFVLEN